MNCLFTEMSVEYLDFGIRSITSQRNRYVFFFCTALRCIAKIEIFSLHILIVAFRMYISVYFERNSIRNAMKVPEKTEFLC